MSLNRVDPIGFVARLEAQNFNIGLVAEFLFADKIIFHRTGTEIRYGTQGSLSINLDKNTYYDHERSEGGGTLDLIQRECNYSNRKEARSWYSQNIENVHQPIKTNKIRENRRIVAEYIYTDSEGNPVLKVVRTEPKGFYQTHWDGGKWQPGGVINPPIFNQKKIIEALKNNKPIAILEGEKDVINAAKIGIIATTKAGGVGKWSGEHLELLKGGCFWVVPDNDQPGQKHAVELAQSLIRNDGTVKIICLPNLSDKGDISDWIESGGTREQFIEIVKNTPVFKGSQASNSENKAPQSSENNLPQVVLTPYSEVESEPIYWLWKNYLAKGKLTLVAGQAGVGKTTAVLNLAAVISRGGSFPDVSRCQAQNIIIWSGEDDPADTIKPRLEAANANMERVFVLSGISVDGKMRAFDPASDVFALFSAIDKIGGAGLIIIDPLISAVSGDSNKAGDVRRSLQPLVDLAARYNCSVAGITHLSKNSQSKDPLDRILGSQAFGAVARVVILMGRTADADQCAFGVVKTNIGKPYGGFFYRIEQATVSKGIETSCTVWGTEIAECVAEHIGPSITIKSAASDSDAVTALKELLEDGERAYPDIQLKMEQGGFTPSQLRGAKDKLRVEWRKEGRRHDSKTFWKLPDPRSSDAKKTSDASDATPTTIASLGKRPSLELGSSNCEQILTDFNEEEGCL